MRQIGILGTGLIGASIGRAAKEAGLTVIAWDPDAERLATAATVGALDTASTDRTDVIKRDLDLLVLATPASVTVELVAELDVAGLVIDVAGAKQAIVTASRLPRFVGTHPMAGREVSGPEAATPTLFRGAAWVVVTDDATAEDVAQVRAFVELLGAAPVMMSAEVHDTTVATVSHLPQLLAAGLVATAAGVDGALELAAGGFRDLTRVAASDPSLWVDVLKANREAVSAAVSVMRTRLDDLEAMLDGDGTELSAFLAESREVRRSMAARATAVRVALADTPGELAKVGRALGATAVDVRDIQLRHAPHGGGGVLTVSVRPGQGAALRHALEAEDLLVVD